MKKLNVMEMRNVEGGAKYAYCPTCGKRKKINWSLAVLFRGWNTIIREEQNKAALRHAWGGKCW